MVTIMKFNDLPKICLALLLVGMIVGVGVLTLDKFGLASIEATAITNESVTISGGEGNLAGYPVLSITEVRNESGATFEAVTDYNYTVATGALEGFATDGDYYFDYSYNRTTPTVTALNGARDAIGPIGSTWMSLIVTIIVLSVLVALVIMSFASYKQR